MAVTEMNLTAKDSIEIQPGRFGCDVRIKADNDEILGHFSVAEILDYFDKDELLEEIGESACREYFGID